MKWNDTRMTTNQFNSWGVAYVFVDNTFSRSAFIWSLFDLLVRHTSVWFDTLWCTAITLQWRHNEHDGFSNHQPHDFLLNRLFKAQIKESIKAPRHWPLCGEFTGEQWIPRTNGQLRGKCFHLMTSSWAYWHGLTLISAWINNHMPSKVWDDITYPLPITYFILYLIIDVTTVGKGDPGIKIVTIAEEETGLPFTTSATKTTETVKPKTN